MTSLLRQIVASPRVRHPEADLDLCYVTDNIIATSGPAASYPQVAYRNQLKELVKFLDKKHGEDWAIWEFRAEGTGYGDDDVYGRIRHYPWPDHHPPPFALVPLMMASMRNWLGEKEGRVAVVHCKAGKGRSGTVACSYLISEEGWGPEEAMKRFTERRMRPGFGVGISIPSQQRTIRYVDRWTKGGKKYVERAVEVVELHVWGLRNGVKIAIEGYVEEGKVIKAFHTFKKSEREIVRGSIQKDSGLADAVSEVMRRGKKEKTGGSDESAGSTSERLRTAANEAMGRDKKVPVGDEVEEEDEPVHPVTVTTSDNLGSHGIDRSSSDLLAEGGDVVFRPSQPVILPSSDMNIDFERRNKSKYGGFTMVTSVAHVWINIFFEGNGPEQNGKADDSGVFEIEWDAMDGIKGSSRKGTRAFDKMAMVWKAVKTAGEGEREIREPEIGEPVQQMKSAEVANGDELSQDFQKKLGLRKPTDTSAAVSRASSFREASKDDDVPDEIEGVKSYSSDVADSGAAGNGKKEGEVEYQPTSDIGSLHRSWKDQHTMS